MPLLKRKPKSFDIQVQDMTLHISAGGDFTEESRASALSFWEQLQAYALRDPEFSTSKRPMELPESAPPIVREIAAAAAAAGVGPMFGFRGALADHVGRFLAGQVHELTVSCQGDFFVVTRKRMKLTAYRGLDGSSLAVVVQPRPSGVGVSTTGDRRAGALDGLAVVADSCMLADAAAAAVQAIAAKPDGFKKALTYLQRVDGVDGGVLIRGSQIGVAGGVEIAA